MTLSAGPVAEQGIYRKHGLDVTILSGGPQSPPPLDLLREGREDFATLWLSTGIQALAQGLNLVNIGFITDLPKQKKPPVSSKPVMGKDQPDKGAAGI